MAEPDFYYTLGVLQIQFFRVSNVPFYEPTYIHFKAV